MVNKELTSHIELVSRISVYVEGLLGVVGIRSTEKSVSRLGALISQHMVFTEPLNGLAKL